MNSLRVLLNPAANQIGPALTGIVPIGAEHFSQKFPESRVDLFPSAEVEMSCCTGVFELDDAVHHQFLVEMVDLADLCGTLFPLDVVTLTDLNLDTDLDKCRFLHQDFLDEGKGCPVEGLS
jgi:hypothetical protein